MQVLMIATMLIMPMLSRFAPESRFATEQDLPDFCQRASLLIMTPHHISSHLITSHLITATDRCIGGCVQCHAMRRAPASTSAKAHYHHGGRNSWLGVAAGQQQPCVMSSFHITFSIIVPSHATQPHHRLHLGQHWHLIPHTQQRLMHRSGDGARQQLLHPGRARLHQR